MQRARSTGRTLRTAKVPSEMAPRGTRKRGQVAEDEAPQGTGGARGTSSADVKKRRKGEADMEKAMLVCVWAQRILLHITGSAGALGRSTFGKDRKAMT